MRSLLAESEHRISHECFVRFQFVYTDLKLAERKAADFCLSHPEIVANSMIGEVAEKAGCSEATLVRLAKRLDYHGYPELRESLLREDSGEIVSTIGINPDDDVQSITRNIINASILSLQDSLKSINYQLLEQAICAIEKASHILFCAAGDANIVALTGVRKMLRIGHSASFSSDFDSQLLSLSRMQKGDVMICISHSGRTQNVYNLAKIAKSHGVQIISLTSFPQSPVAKISDITLLTVSFTKDIMGEVITKRVPALCIIDAIYVCLLIRLPKSQLDTMDRGNKLLRNNKIERR